ncbi:hypothetical protein TNCV_3329541 [Trichonephila clavipes]|nr:hypothetical protein TNCV_3329541 [Trichonephila clavipes]
MSLRLMPLKTHRVEGLMHVTYVEAQTSSVDVVWELGVPPQMSSSSSDYGSKLRGSSLNLNRATFIFTHLNRSFRVWFYEDQSYEIGSYFLKKSFPPLVKKCWDHPASPDQILGCIGFSKGDLTSDLLIILDFFGSQQPSGADLTCQIIRE